MNESKLKFLKEEYNNNYTNVFCSLEEFITFMQEDVLTCNCGKHYWNGCKKFCGCKNKINDTRIH